MPWLGEMGNILDTKRQPGKDFDKRSMSLLRKVFEWSSTGVPWILKLWL
jgi:hypothetical protein